MKGNLTFTYFNDITLRNINFVADKDLELSKLISIQNYKPMRPTKFSLVACTFDGTSPANQPSIVPAFYLTLTDVTQLVLTNVDFSKLTYSEEKLDLLNATYPSSIVQSTQMILQTVTFNNCTF